jgi:hypothetical protein
MMAVFWFLFYIGGAVARWDIEEADGKGFTKSMLLGFLWPCAVARYLVMMAHREPDQ